MNKKQNPTILIVEANELVRPVLVEMLNGGRFAIFNCGSAQEALSYASRGDHFDVLVTDLFLPEMGGETLANRIRALGNPAMRVLFISSQQDPPASVAQVKDAGQEILEKPFGVLTFRQRVARMLSNLHP